MATNRNGEQQAGVSFSISNETAKRIELLQKANRLFNETFEAIRSTFPTVEGNDNTAEADRAFSEYFGEAQKVTRDAYKRYVADAIGEALLDDTNTEI